MERGDLLGQLMDRYPALAACREEIQAAFDMLLACYRGGGKVLLCGNGGSAADGAHIAGELMKGFLKKRPLGEGERAALCAADPVNGAYLAEKLQGGLAALPLSGADALPTAVLNDISGDLIYAQQAQTLTKPGDVLLGISTSGNARNVLLAAVCARAKGGKVLALTGGDGGALGRYADLAIRVPERETYRIQELHLPVYHCLCAMLEEALFDA